jgi:hypothetical protein
MLPRAEPQHHYGRITLGSNVFRNKFAHMAKMLDRLSIVTLFIDFSG